MSNLAQMFAEKAPALRCKFTADNGTALTAYPWTATDEVRPVGAQWEIPFSTVVGFTITSNRAVLASIGGSGITFASRPRKIIAKLKQTNVAGDIAIFVRQRIDAGQAGSLGYQIYLINDTTKKIEIYKDSTTLVATSTLDTADWTAGDVVLVVYDDGRTITAECVSSTAGVMARVSLETTTYNDVHGCGLLSDVQAATASASSFEVTL